MNILPTGPDNEHDPNWDRYYADLHRWNFDVAYNAFYAFPMRLVRGKYDQAYRSFARRAKEDGVPCCVQIQSVVANLEDVPISESQRYIDNTYHLYEHFGGTGRNYHFASFASKKWLQFLKDLTTHFHEIGFEWVVYEEPMLHTDVPGHDDPICKLFKQRHPNLKYPTRQIESPEYLALQALKRDTLVSFYDELTRHAKQIGFEKAGIMPWFFTPTFENTPPETWNSCCDTGRLAFLPELDFLVVRMQPDNIYAQAMIGASGESTPMLSYFECQAHHAGKPLIMVNNPTDEHCPEANRESSLIPYRFFNQYTLAAAAACPQGMSRHWYGKNYEEDQRYMDLMTEINDVLRRLSPAASEIAFVYSYEGGSHVWPRPWRETWRTYWSFAEPMVNMQIPFLTFFAETLQQSLEEHPEVAVVVLNEYYPIPPHEVEFLEKWVKARADRRLIYFGGRDGYHWKHERLHQEYKMLPPEMLSLFGVDTTKPVQSMYADPGERLGTPGEHDDHEHGECGCLTTTATCFCVPVFAEPVDVLLESSVDRIPAVTRRAFGAEGGEAWFVGMPLEPGCAIIIQVMDAVMSDRAERVSSPRPIYVESTGPGIYYNTTQNGYFVLANCTSTERRIELTRKVRAFVPKTGSIKNLQKFDQPPMSLTVFRMLEENTRVYDVKRAILVKKIEETEGRAMIEGMFHRESELVLAAVPTTVKVDGANVEFSVVRKKKDMAVVQVKPGKRECRVEVRW